VNKNLNILHVAWGFYPWRKGGLILYARDLMKEQINSGHQVSYFCAGRKVPIFKKNFLHTWTSAGLNIYEIINSKISHRGDSGTLNPEVTLQEPCSEKYFSTIIEKINPDIIHIHELAGLPSSIIDLIVDKYKIPCLMTLADYYLICPCLKLFNHFTKENCRLQNDFEKKCHKCIISAPKKQRNDVFETVSLLLTNIEIKFNLTDFSLWQNLRSFCYKVYTCYQINKRKYIMKKLYNEKTNKMTNRNFEILLQKRRYLNLIRLKKVSHLIARSKKVKQIYDSYLKTDNKVSVVNPHLHHIDSISQKKILPDIKIVKFVTLNGFYSRQKGGELLLDAIIFLNRHGYINQFEIHSLGHVHRDYVKKLNSESNFYNHGLYEGNQLDILLDPMHVGILPSIWEEVFGYVGLELLAKGLPVIANKKGGITDYIVHDENGYLNESCSLNELILWMEKYLKNKNKIYEHNQNIINAWDRSYSKHYSKIMQTYEFVLQKNEKAHNV
jgi:glycosyltransferase involved in cell wall biosynthesis